MLADLGMFRDVLGLHLGSADVDWNHLLFQQGSEAWHNWVNHLKRRHKTMETLLYLFVFV